MTDCLQEKMFWEFNMYELRVVPLSRELACESAFVWFAGTTPEVRQWHWSSGYWYFKGPLTSSKTSAWVFLFGTGQTCALRSSQNHSFLFLCATPLISAGRIHHVMRCFSAKKCLEKRQQIVTNTMCWSLENKHFWHHVMW